MRHKINSAFLEKHSAVKVGKTGAMFARLRAGSQGSPPGKVPSLLPRCITFEKKFSTILTITEF